MSTEISWTDETWNPTVGCSRVSAGCDNCYAMKVAHRGLTEAHKGLTFYDDSGEHRSGNGGIDWTGEVRVMPDRLDTPLHWRKPRRVFVDSMSDLFHDDVPVEFIQSVWVTMCKTPQHTYQVLTKRPARMMRLLNAAPDWVVKLATLPNVWLGTSIENDRYARIRIPHLLRTPAAVRFLSVEPMLGDVDLHPYLDQGIGWVIVGGESGPGARPIDLAWVERVIVDCEAAGVPVFVKQLGSVWAKEHGAADRKGGAPAEWPKHLRVRVFPESVPA